MEAERAKLFQNNRLHDKLHAKQSYLIQGKPKWFQNGQGAPYLGKNLSAVLCDWHLVLLLGYLLSRHATMQLVSWSTYKMEQKHTYTEYLEDFCSCPLYDIFSVAMSKSCILSAAHAGNTDNIHTDTHIYEGAHTYTNYTHTQTFSHCCLMCWICTCNTATGERRRNGPYDNSTSHTAIKTSVLPLVLKKGTQSVTVQQLHSFGSFCWHLEVRVGVYA